VREQWDRSTTGWNHHTAAIRAWLRQPTDAMLDLALHNAPQAGLRNVQTLVADGEQLAVEPRQL
jgi:hypothetical protein